MSKLGQAGAGVQHNHVPLRLARLKAPLLAQVALAPEQTLAQLCLWVRAEYGMQVGAMNMGKTLARFGLPRKKRLCMPANKSETTSPRRARPGRTNKLRWPASS